MTPKGERANIKEAKPDTAIYGNNFRLLLDRLVNVSLQVIVLVVKAIKVVFY